MKRAILVLVCVLLFLGGCATVKPMSPKETFDKYGFLGDLNQRINKARDSEVDVLAPLDFKGAEEELDEAIDSGRKNDRDKARAAADAGVRLIERAESDAARSREIMWEVLAVRAKARKAGAGGEQLEKAEQSFREANQLVERGDTEGAKKRRPELIQVYGSLEVKSLKEGAVDIARASFQEAKRVEAEDYAPKTFKKAQQAINLANSVLEQDATRVEEARVHARDANRLSWEAVQITELAKTFKRRDLSREDIILWYQQQLAEINQPLGAELDFGQPNRTVVASMHDSISRLVETNKGTVKTQKKTIAELSEAAKAQTEAEQRFATCNRCSLPTRPRCSARGTTCSSRCPVLPSPLEKPRLLPRTSVS